MTNIDYNSFTITPFKKILFSCDKIYNRNFLEDRCVVQIQFDVRNEIGTQYTRITSRIISSGGRSDEPFPVGVKEHLISTS